MSNLINKTAVREFVKTELKFRASESMIEEIDKTIKEMLTKAKARSEAAGFQTIKARHI